MLSWPSTNQFLGSRNTYCMRQARDIAKRHPLLHKGLKFLESNSFPRTRPKIGVGSQKLTNSTTAKLSLAESPGESRGFGFSFLLALHCVILENEESIMSHFQSTSLGSRQHWVLLGSSVPLFGHALVREANNKQVSCTTSVEND